MFSVETRAAIPTQRSNILFITADDMGLQAGCYGDSTARTPNLDRLAEEGVRFTTVYVTQSSCSSSRSSFLTGFYPHQNGQVGLAHRGYSMARGIPTLPTILKAAGYRTGIIGKLHVKPAVDFDFDFQDLPAEPTRKVRDVADKAARFWSETSDAPWFLYVNYFDPHIPLITQVEGLQVAWLDLLGDWREEIVTSLPGELRIYVTPIAAIDRRVTFLQDRHYRNGVAHLSMGYAHPPLPGGQPLVQ